MNKPLSIKGRLLENRARNRNTSFKPCVHVHFSCCFVERNMNSAKLMNVDLLSVKSILEFTVFFCPLHMKCQNALGEQPYILHT